MHSHWQYLKFLVAHLPHQHCYSHCLILNLNHPNRYIVVSILVLIFLMTNNGWASLYVFICLCFLFSEVSVQIFHSFFFFLCWVVSFLNWVGRVIYIFWLAVLYLVHICRIFSHPWGLSFHYFDNVFQRAEVFISMKSNLPFFYDLCFIS